MYKVIISKQAGDDVENVISYIALDSPYRAISFTGELLNSAKSLLSSFPLAGKDKGKVRVMVCRGYYIFYKVKEQKKEVHLLRVLNPANYTAYSDY